MSHCPFDFCGSIVLSSTDTDDLTSMSLLALHQGNHFSSNRCSFSSGIKTSLIAIEAPLSVAIPKPKSFNRSRNNTVYLKRTKNSRQGLINSHRSSILTNFKTISCPKFRPSRGGLISSLESVKKLRKRLPGSTRTSASRRTKERSCSKKCTWMIISLSLISGPRFKWIARRSFRA